MKTQNNTIKLSKNAKLILITLGILIFFSIWNSNNGTDGNLRTTKFGFYAAYEEESLKQAIRLINHNDEIALNQLLYQGEIFELQGGKEIHIIDSNFGLVKIRFRGTNEQVWTIIEALNKQ